MSNKISLSSLSSLGISVFTYESTDSTSLRAREYANRGGTLPALFVANAQTQGRGRLGRSFYSPKDTGIYMSLLFQATDIPQDSLSLTAAAAVAVRRAILKWGNINTSIKWVNDIYIENRKIAGILAESFFAEGKRLVSVGVGVNLSTRDFPEELSGRAGSLIESDALSDAELSSRRLSLTENIARELLAVISAPSKELMEEYKSASAVIGKRVSFTENFVTKTGTALDIDMTGALIVRMDDGSSKRLASGEITLRFDNR